MSDSKRAPEWYREWFGEEYLALYPHRDQEEATAAVELTLEACGRPAGRTLDLACGAGRHMVEFERRGIEAVGLDLSGPLLRQARARGRGLALVRGDMRALPFADGTFDTVVNFFTSFGYFAEPEEDARVLAEVRRVLRRGGCFLLDFLNADRVRRNLVPRDERRLGDRRVVQERRLEDGGRIVVKEIRIFGPDGGAPTGSYLERVRLYAPDELAALLEAARLQPERSYGDYSGAPACADCPRHIIVGHAV